MQPDLRDVAYWLALSSALCGAVRQNQTTGLARGPWRAVVGPVGQFVSWVAACRSRSWLLRHQFSSVRAWSGVGQVGNLASAPVVSNVIN